MTQSGPLALWVGNPGALQYAVSGVLREAGYEVESVPDYWRAMRFCRIRQYAIVILGPIFAYGDALSLLSDIFVNDYSPYLVVADQVTIPVIPLEHGKRLIRLPAPYRGDDIAAVASFAAHAESLVS